MVKLSVLMTAYNTEKYIEQCINSILEQSFYDFELIIVDDGSTDRTVKIIESYNDTRIKLYILGTNYGVGYANNFAISKATGEYIAKVDSDDILDPKRFQTQINFLDNNCHVDVVDSFVDYFTDDPVVLESERFSYHKIIKTQHINQLLSIAELSKQIYMHSIIIHGAVMARTKKFQSVNYNSNYRIAEDYDLFYKLNKKGHNFTKLPLVLTKVRISTESTSAKFYNENFETIFQIKLEEIAEIVMDKSKPLAIWGVGRLGVKLKELLDIKFQVKPSLFIDSFSINKEIEDSIPIVKPSKVNLLDYNIIIASSPGKLDISNTLDKEGLIFLQDYMVFI